MTRLPLELLEIIRYLSPSFKRGYWESRNWLQTFGSDEMSYSDKSCDLFELYVGDGTFAQHTGLYEEEHSQLFDEVLPCPPDVALGAVPEGLQPLGHDTGVAQDKRTLPKSGWSFGATRRDRQAYHLEHDRAHLAHLARRYQQL